MSPQPLTIDNFVARRLGELIEQEGEVTDFELRRLEGEIRRMPDSIRRDCLLTTLHGLAGNYKEARRIIDPYRNLALGVEDGIDVAAAFHVAQRFEASSSLVKSLLKQDHLDQENAGLVLQVAAGVCAFNLAGDIMDRAKLTGAVFADSGGSELAVQKCRELGIHDDDLQPYVQSCVDAILPWAEGGRRAIAQCHTLVESSDQVILVIDLMVPAEPEQFGDIMWAIASIDKSEYSEAVERYVLVDAIPMPEIVQ